MKKFHFTFLLVITLLAGTQSFGQMAIDKGTSFVNLGIGVGGYGYFSGGSLGFGASYDLGIIPNVTVGGIAGYRGYGEGVKSFDIGARGSYHFNELLQLSTDKVDLYAGVGLSYYNISYGEYYRALGVPGYATSYNRVYFLGHAGGRYLFTEKIGGFAELGSSLATLRLGVTIKL